MFDSLASKICLLVGIILAVVLVFLILKPQGSGSLLSIEFSDDPTSAGWTGTGNATWSKSSGCITAKGSGASWVSPSFAMDAGQYYKIEYSSSARSGCGVAVFATNPAVTFGLEPASGNDGPNPLYYRRAQLLADIYGMVPPSDQVISSVTYFRAPSQAKEGFLRFSTDGGILSLKRVAVSKVKMAEVTSWSDTLWAQSLRGVRVGAELPRDRFTRLARTFEKLRIGEAIRCAFVGDSIAADTLNSRFDVLVHRLYPAGPPMRVIEATGHGTGMAAWNTPGGSWQQAGLKFTETVNNQSPDLVILGGISNGGAQNLAATGALIDRIRLGNPAGRESEILLMTGPAYAGSAPDLANYRDSLEAMAASKNVAFFDFYSAWKNCLEQLEAQGVPAATLQRDPVHNNDLGKELLGRVMESYFMPTSGT